MSMRSLGLMGLLFCLGCIGLPTASFAHTLSHCARPAAGSAANPPPELFAFNGALHVHLDYYTELDSAGRTLFCFVTPNGEQAPTLHVEPGNVIEMTVTNHLPAPPAGSPSEVVSNAKNRCGQVTMTVSSVNMHFHGTNTSPTCHSDEVIHTLINSGESFTYLLKIPSNEPPGLYWYHPHVHGIAEAAVQGGASGAIVVGGIENLQPAVAGLPERVLLIRDQTVAGNPNPGGPVPSWDLSVNYVPVSYPNFAPAVIRMRKGGKEFWRVVNASADSLLDLQVIYDGRAQPLQIVALDGVPVGSRDGTARGQLITQNHIFLATAARAEFIVEAPSPSVKHAILQTLNVDTGPDGDNDPQRPLIAIEAVSTPPALPIVPRRSGIVTGGMFSHELAAAVPTAHRHLYFSEVLSDPSDPNSPTNFFITVDGTTPTLFDANNPPAIVTHQGAIEDWTISNQALENHEFHIHQIHFLLLAVNGVPVPASEQQFYDTYQVPYWSGTGPYPTITVRMDFTGTDIGDFVYHCHILGHEDAGMMAVLRVLPPHF